MVEMSSWESLSGQYKIPANNYLPSSPGQAWNVSPAWFPTCIVGIWHFISLIPHSAAPRSREPGQSAAFNQDLPFYLLVTPILHHSDGLHCNISLETEVYTRQFRHWFGGAADFASVIGNPDRSCGAGLLLPLSINHLLIFDVAHCWPRY